MSRTYRKRKLSFVKEHYYVFERYAHFIQCPADNTALYFWGQLYNRQEYADTLMEYWAAYKFKSVKWLGNGMEQSRRRIYNKTFRRNSKYIIYDMERFDAYDVYLTPNTVNVKHPVKDYW